MTWLAFAAAVACGLVAAWRMAGIERMESGKRRELWSVFSFWMVIFWLWWKIGGPEWVDWTARGLAVGFLVGLACAALEWLLWLRRGGRRAAGMAAAAAGRKLRKEAVPAGLVLALLVWLAWPAKNESPEEPVAVVEAPATLAVVAAEAGGADDWEARKRRRQAAADGCQCVEGARCRGPQGGIYCWTGDNQKQYFPRQK